MKRPRDESDSSSQRSDSGSDQASTYAEDIKYQLQHILDSLSSTARFATSGQVPHEVNPGLVVAGLGGIGLPLSEREALLLANVSHQAPFGSGSDTITECAVRDTLELNADRFELQSPKWKGVVDEVARQAATDIGVSDKGKDVKAILHKLLLYRKGSMFKEHRDSEKEPGMFGTLVICLPSRHEGGEVHLTHGGHKKVLQTAELSPFTYSFLCWYGDIKHEITAITSGFRLVLTYNLVRNISSRPITLPSVISPLKSDLERLLSSWKAKYVARPSGRPDVLAYILDHAYTEHTLSFKGMKGSDRDRVETLADLCEKAGFQIYFALVKSETRGNCEDECNDENAWEDMYWRAVRGEEPEYHYISEVLEEFLHLTHVVDLDGVKLADLAPFTTSRIIQKRPFNGAPDYEEFSGPTGNEGVTAAHFYSRSAVLLMPAEHRIDFYYGCHQDSKKKMMDWLNQLTTKIPQMPEADRLPRTELKKACMLIINGNSTDLLLDYVVRAAVHTNDITLCRKALSKATIEFAHPITTKAIVAFGFEQLKSSLESGIVHIHLLHHRINALVAVYDHYKALRGEDSETLSALLTWMSSLDSKIGLGHVQITTDGASLAELKIRCGRVALPDEVLFAMRQTKRSTYNYHSAYGAVLGFLTTVFGHWQENKFDKDDARQLFTSTIREFISVAELAKLTTQNHKPARISDPYYDHRVLLSSEHMVSLIDQCVSLDLCDLACELLDWLERLALGREPVVIFTKFYLPLVAKMSDIPRVQILANAGEELRTKIQLLSAKLFDLFARRCVGVKPAPLVDARREKCGCGCSECLQLDAFLDHATQYEIKMITGNEERAKHVISRLPRIQKSLCELIQEHDSQMERMATGETQLTLRKTLLAWTTEVEHWEKDRNTAEKVLFTLFKDDEVVKARWRENIERLSQGEIGPA